MSDYPRDLKDKDGKIREFKRIEDVPPGWFIRDTGEEVNPQAVDAPEDLKPKKGKVKPIPLPASHIDGEPVEPDAE